MAGVPNAGVQRQLAEEKTVAAIKTRIEIFRSFVRCRATAAQPAMYLAPWAGVEPATFRLTVERSTAELPGNSGRLVMDHQQKLKTLVASKRPPAVENRPTPAGLAPPFSNRLRLEVGGLSCGP